MNKTNIVVGLFLIVGVIAALSIGQLFSEEQKIVKLSDQTLSENKTSIYGTLHPFASEAVYFLMTDRFVDGDPNNNFEKQGGELPTFRQRIADDNGNEAFVGYMGGDFKGILDNAGYINELGFTSIWLTPIVDQPDEAFNGGEKIEYGGAFKDGGKTGYHGYWGVNFFKVDEHLPSPGLSFKQLTQSLKKQHNIKTVLDVVANHGSPSFTMKKNQPKFGQLFNQKGQLVADHQNLKPEDLDTNNPLHQLYRKQSDIMQLSDMDYDNPAVLDYFVAAYLQWIEQGADALRIDTIKHMPHHFWKKFSDRIREKHPELFMFAESYSFDPEFIAQHTLQENGAVSVLDFPGREAMLKVFEDPGSSYSDILSYLYLEDGPYANSYELMTFYDNHDMSRINTDSNGFIDVNNWLFTSRGIPVVYYGSEIGFMAGRSEHQGNRNYFGVDNITKAQNSPIAQSLSRIANIRKNNIALQKGLQINLEFKEQSAAFYRVYQHQGVNQTALVLLNKGDQKKHFKIKRFLSEGVWKNTTTGKSQLINKNQAIEETVNGHSVTVFLLNKENKNKPLLKEVTRLMERDSSL